MRETAEQDNNRLCRHEICVRESAEKKGGRGGDLLHSVANWPKVRPNNLKRAE